MRKLYLFLFFSLSCSSLMGYEFTVSSLSTSFGKPIPKQVLVRRKPAAVLFVKTSLSNLQDMSDSTIEQFKTKEGYVFYIAPDWPAVLWLTAPNFVPKMVEIGPLSSNVVYEMEVSAVGKDPTQFNLSAAKLSFAKDVTNATAATSQTYAPEIWINTDASFSQIKELLKEGKYTVIRQAVAPYRISPNKKQAKLEDVLSPLALQKLGNIYENPLEERTVYNLDIIW